MHGRHRSPANGFRSNSIKFGSQGLGRANGQRSFTRGFGRGRGRPRHSQPPRGGDIFMEAGRLAAEYLVSKGVLSPTVLSGKWQNGSLKNQGHDFSEFRGDGDGVQIQSGGRVSALSRLGNGAADSVPGRRRLDEDYSPRGSGSHGKGIRRGGLYRCNGSDWSREYGRTSLFLDKGKDCPDEEDGSDDVSGGNEDLQVEKDNGNIMQKFGESELASTAADLDHEIDNFDLTDDMALNESPSSAEKDGLTKTNKELGNESKDHEDIDQKIDRAKNGIACEEPTKEIIEEDLSVEPSAACKFVQVPTKVRSEDLTYIDENIEKMKNGIASEEPTKEKIEEDQSVEPSATESDCTGNNCANLLAFCKFAQVPTKTRSSLASRRPKVVPLSNSKDDQKSNVVPQVLLENDSTEDSSGDAPLHKNRSSNDVDSEVKETFCLQSSKDQELGPAYVVDQNKCTDSQLSPDTKVLSAQSSKDAQNTGTGCSLEQGKCTMSESFPLNKILQAEPVEYVEDISSASGAEQSKFLRSNSFPGRDLFHQNDQESHRGSPELGSSSSTVINRPEKRALGDSDMNEGSKKARELPPTIAMRTETNGVHQSYPAIFYPSIHGNQTATHFDIDFPMNNLNTPGHFRYSSSFKEIEVIDLEDDSAQEEKADENSETKRETLFADRWASPDHPPSSGVITDVQDNFEGLVFSEFLNSFQNCAAAPADVNSFPNEIGISNGVGAFRDDDSIYMSLDEIPLSMPELQFNGFMRAWEQPPPQEYDKHF